MTQTIQTLFDANGTQPNKTLEFDSPASFFDHYRQQKHQPLADVAEAPHFSMCDYEAGQGEQAPWPVRVTAVVITPAGILGLDALGQFLDRIPYACAVSSTHDSTVDAFRIQLIFPLVRPVSVKQFEQEQVAQRLAAMLGVQPTPDNEKANSTYPLPACPLDTDPESWVLEAQGERPVLKIEDLPPQKQTSPMPTKITKGATRNKAKAVDEDEVEKIGVLQEIDHYVAQHCGGVQPIFAEGNFHVYDGQIWLVKSEKTLCRHLFVEVFDCRAQLSFVQAMLAHMKVMFMREQFPDPISMQTSRSGRERVFRIALKNCTVDPLEGKVVPNSPDYYLRTRLEFDYDPEAQCVRFDEYLREIFEPDADQEEKIMFVTEMMGYLLVPVTYHEVMFLLVGEGSNGKSVLLQVLRWVLGQSNVANVPLTKIAERFSTIQLVGKLANFDDDVRVGKTVSDDHVKKLASGNPMQAEQKGMPAFTFQPFARIVAAANRLPETRDSSDGYFRRLKIVTFNRQFKGDEKDLHLQTKLRAELPGIFNMAMQGLQQLEREGAFTELPSSTEMVASYQKQSNPVTLFLDEETISGNGMRTPTTDLYAAYGDFCMRNRYRALSSAQFGVEMKRLGHDVTKSNGKRYYPVKLRPDDENFHMPRGRTIEEQLEQRRQRKQALADGFDGC
jgi:P4 family phage/plasmid primase-like protien